jgi:TfoX N-terminal domain
MNDGDVLAIRQRIRAGDLFTPGGNSRLGTIGAWPTTKISPAGIRDLIGPDPELTEKKMFGGLAFLIRGHMAISASGQGGVLVQVDPGRSAGLVATTKAATAVMQGREMPGWLRVSPEDLASDDDLSRWVDIGIGYARSLPPKQPGSRKPKK